MSIWKRFDINWMGKKSAACIGIKEFATRDKEIINYHQLTGSTDLPPLGWKNEGSSKVVFKTTFQSVLKALFKEPVPIQRDPMEQFMTAEGNMTPLKETEVSASSSSTTIDEYTQMETISKE